MCGGTPTRTLATAPWPLFEQDEIDAVSAVLSSGKVNYWTGPQCRAFEDEYAAFVGVPHAISLSNGTVALELALKALGVQAGDEVIVPAKTFIASASAVVTCGARPVVADVDLLSQNLTADTIRAVLTPRTKAIVIVHLGGWPAKMDAIMALAREHGLWVIEDCAQAHGAEIDGKPVGSFGDCGAFSFCQDKIITTGGEGGMLVIKDEAVWKRAWAYKDHGKGYDRVHQENHPKGFRWLHDSFGTNMRMTEMQAAIGRLQLRKLPHWHARRTENALALHEGLQDVPGLVRAMPDTAVKHGWYRYYAFLDLPKLAPGWDLVAVVEAISAEGVPCFVGSCSEIYREKAFVDNGWGLQHALPNAGRLTQSSLALLVHPTLSVSDMQIAAAAIKKVMAVALSQALA
ncbi:MAG: DegT/DnrJ/EryC1/StrS aminotransferase family protein [Herbaspirillum sp.]|nr:DegT/DnrJ/EryC1/StrS aminotransferase family protein [Herbaspirillum sp.]